MSGKVPPSSRAGKVAVRGSDAARAKARYTRFTGHDAEYMGSISVPPIPKALACIGGVHAIEYVTMRDGKIQTFRHVFAVKDAPLLGISPDGKQIHLVGGEYTFTDRGIVDKSYKG